MGKPIFQQAAIEICRQIQNRYSRKFFTAVYWQCWGCVKFSKGDIKKMCFANNSDNRGCNLVNKQFDAHN